jgi:putative hydrolase of the HAD superfamily
MVCFDADQTLFDFHKVMMEALAETSDFFETKGLKTTPELLKTVRDQIALEYANKSIDMLELRRLSFLKISCSQSLASEALQIFQDVRFGRVYFYDGTIDALKRLREMDVVVSLITNGNSDPKKAGIDEYFDHILLGEKFPYKKPDKRIFMDLLDISGQTKENVMHVGDSLENDVLGANNAGICSVWFNQFKLDNTTSITPDYEISHMSEIISLVG